MCTVYKSHPVLATTHTSSPMSILHYTLSGLVEFELKGRRDDDVGVSLS